MFTDSPFDLESSEWENWEYYDVNDLGQKKEQVFKCVLKTINEFTLGNTKEYLGNIYGGEVGIILDGRGRPFNFDNQNRRELIDNWRESMNEYPNMEI